MEGDYQFNRALLKRNARENLRGKYGAALVAVVLAQITAELFYGIVRLLTNSLTSNLSAKLTPPFFEADIKLFNEQNSFLRDLLERFSANRLTLFSLIFISMIAAFLYALFVSNLIRIGLKRWFLRASHPQYPAPSMGPLFSSFKRGQYLVTFKAAFWKSMWLFVWSIPVILMIMIIIIPVILLFDAYVRTGADAITPELVDRVLKAYGLPDFFFSQALFVSVGLALIVFMIILQIKRYQYRMTDYILADNPRIGSRRALDLSKQMSKGSLWRFFILELSFIGWFVAASMFICLPGISVFLVFPYYEATWVEAYKNRRDELVARHELTMEELGYIRIRTGY